MNRMRLRIAERLKQSQNTAASLTTFNEVDMSSIMEFRKLYKDEILKNKGVKLGFMSAFSRACILAMRDVPAVNASIEGPKGGDTIVYRDYVDISVAVATDVVDSGNTSSASVPLAMEAMLRQDEASAGDTALLIAFGAGLSYAGQVVTLPPLAR